MSKISQTKQLVLDLQTHISGLLTKDEIEKLKSIIVMLGLIDRAPIEGCKSFADIWRLLEDGDHLEEGNYATVALLFDKMKMHKLVGEIKEREKNIKDAMRRSAKQVPVVVASPQTDAILDMSAMKKPISQPSQPRSDQSDQDVPVYDMFAKPPKPRGLCIIFSIINFKDSVNDGKVSTPTQVVDEESRKQRKLKTRKGGEYDQHELVDLFKELNFQVELRKDPKSKDIMSEVESMAQYHVKGEHDCLVMFILSHGRRGAIVGADGEPVEIDEIVDHFKPALCRPLAGKPKMFFIQACQGDKHCIPVEFDSEVVGESIIESKPKTSLPNESDILIGYASTPGYTSWRDPQRGTHYILSLVDMIRKHGNRHDLLEILTFVNEAVAKKYIEARDEHGITSVYKQSPLIHSTLRKKVYLKSAGDV